LKSFSGGVHPPTSKDLTKGTPIAEARLPDRVVIPLKQCLGAPSEACVKIGDEVKVGQKIGTASGFVSVPLHASISGKVTAIGRFPHPLGGEDRAVVIEGDGTDEWDDSVRPRSDVSSLGADDVREIVREAGIVGLGGAAFPTHVKLSPPEGKPIDTVIMNGAECEPWLTADHRLMLEKPEEILLGFGMIMKALGCERGFVGIEANKMDAVESVRKAVPGDLGVKVLPLHVKYPQGAEKQLIDAILRRRVPAGGLPLDVGVVVQNVGTALAVYEACYLGRPLTRRVMTLTGRAVARPTNFLARIGTLVSDLAREAGGLEREIAKAISGGPMMGIAQFTLDVPVIKGMSGILVLTADEVEVFEPAPCLRCGRCVTVCPMKLAPTTIEQLVIAERIEQADKIGLLDCIECGSCSYVCPSKRRLVHYFKYGKNRAMALRRAARERESKDRERVQADAR
jgi:electron transport complex protein RnfC